MNILFLFLVTSSSNSFAQQTDSGLKATFIGGPTVLLEIGKVRILTDPTFDQPGARFNIRGNHIVEKMSGPALEHVGEIDIVLLSHDQHPDNLDSAGRRLLKSVKKVFTTRDAARRLQNNSRGLEPFEQVTLENTGTDKIIITAVPARHGPYGIEQQTGTVTGFIITVKGLHNFQVYISGDTEYYSDIDEIARRFQPKYAFIFAGAAQPSGPINVSMNTNDAIEVARIFPKAIIIPIHSEGWSHYTQHNIDYVKAFNALGIGGRLKILKPGITTEM